MVFWKRKAKGFTVIFRGKKKHCQRCQYRGDHCGFEIRCLKAMWNSTRMDLRSVFVYKRFSVGIMQHLRTNIPWSEVIEHHDNDFPKTLKTQGRVLKHVWYLRSSRYLGADCLLGSPIMLLKWCQGRKSQHSATNLWFPDCTFLSRSPRGTYPRRAASLTATPPFPATAWEINKVGYIHWILTERE